ncbi:universal stress protein [Haloferax sp. ATB1]|uniref:universal stress protein n=1 Tax=Haloferax sp. ATB1 TaxID=1508454 RepID=UPI0005B20D71|nr:universal stress protein [Haloferax sp. ATB1]
MVVLVPVGEEPNSEEAVQLAYEIAQKYDDTLVALHVIPNKEFAAYKESLTSLPEFDDYSFTQEADKAADIAEKILEIYLDDFDSTMVETRGRVGNHSSEILYEADSLEPRFIVIGGRRKSPVGKAIFGNTIQDVLLNAQSPVVTTMRD